MLEVAAGIMSFRDRDHGQGTGIRILRCCLESDLLLTAPHWKYSYTANENVLCSLATC